MKEPSRKPQPLLLRKHDDAKEKMGGVPYARDRARSSVLALGADADAASSNTVPRLQNSETFSLSEISVEPPVWPARPLLSLPHTLLPLCLIPPLPILRLDISCALVQIQPKTILVAFTTSILWHWFPVGSGFRVRHHDLAGKKSRNFIVHHGDIPDLNPLLGQQQGGRQSWTNSSFK